MSSVAIENLPLDSLELDLENPRLPLSFRSQQLGAKDVVNWLLEDASIIELMTAIGQNGFFPGEALLVTKKNNSDKYVVVEGNRRLTSVLLLSQPDLATIHRKKIEQVLIETTHRPKSIPCIVFDTREEILSYLGYRHVTGVKSWSLVAKARYLNGLKAGCAGSISEQSRELAKKIGSRSDYVKKLLVSYQIYEVIEDERFFGIPGIDDTNFYFNYISDSISREHIKNFIGVDLDAKDPISSLNMKNLRKLMYWFFEKNDKNNTKVKGHSADLTKLNRVLSSGDALEYFEKTGDLSDSEALVGKSPETFSQEILSAIRTLKFANSFIHKVEHHNEADISLLKEINDLCRAMRDVIMGKEEKKDEWDD